mmetsp:Transcript_6138/g.8039  ORF Transcript_6138/g.8039 Transcript_6138/m.8039 type:complete len:370 (-) Transcript_6138:1218-2327(-)
MFSASAKRVGLGLGLGFTAYYCHSGVHFWTSFAYADSSSTNKSSKSILGGLKISDKPQCLAVSSYAARGPRASMEDEHYVSADGCFFGVFDGHGGQKVAKYARQRVFPYLVDLLKNGQSISEALAGTFERVSEEVDAGKTMDYMGSTAVAVLLEEGKIWSANIGDSRAVLCRNGQAFDLTKDHKPNLPAEKARIEALGGSVQWYGYLGPDRQPVPGMGAYRVNGNLAVSRALGDKLERPFVTADPDIVSYDRDSENDQFIVLASDGLWDVMTSHDCVKFVQQILSGSVGALYQEGGNEDYQGRPKGTGLRRIRRPSRPLSQWVNSYSEDRGVVRAVLDTRRDKMAQYLVEESLRRGTADNVTVLVVWLR